MASGASRSRTRSAACSGPGWPCSSLCIRAARPASSSRARSRTRGLALAFWGSIVFRRPLVGFFVAPLYHFPPGWYRDPRIRRAFSEGTAAFAIVFTVRAVVYTVLILAEREAALAGAVVVLGWPAFLGALWFCYRYIPRRLRQLGIDPDELRQKPAH